MAALGQDKYMNCINQFQNIPTYQQHTQMFKLYTGILLCELHQDLQDMKE